MKIGIDARFYGPEGTGIGRYVEKLLVNLEQVDDKNEYTVFLREENFRLYNPNASNFRKIKADASWYSLKEQVIMPAVLLKEKLDLVHFPHFNIPLLYPGKFVVTVHDLTKSKFGSKAASTRSLPVYLAKQNLYKITMNQAVSKAKMIFVPSEYVKTQLQKSLKTPAEKIVVTYEGAEEFYDPSYSPSEGKVKEILGKYSIKTPFLIFVGNTYPYKNVEVVLEALLDLPTELKFVCVAPRNKFLDRLLSRAEELGVKNRLVTTGFVNDEDLKLLFKVASCFVFPSLSEGFGLPALEAMGVGCPVIAADSSSLPEVYQDGALYFDPKKPKELVKKVTLILNDQQTRNNLIAQGYQQVRKYSWRKMAEQTAKVYNVVLNSQKS
jgi:glycosyltransferase involved in cell wall biosynthesis